MKCTNYLILFSILMIQSCKENAGSEPASVYFYVSIKTESGEDFFAKNNAYDASKIELVNVNDNSRFQPTEVFERAGYTTFYYQRQQAYFSGSVYIDYGNNDIDTLEIEYLPRLEAGSDPFEGVNQVDFYFNGDLIKTWDFEEKPELRKAVIFSGVDPNSPDYKEIYGEGIIWITKEVSDE